MFVYTTERGDVYNVDLKEVREVKCPTKCDDLLCFCCMGHYEAIVHFKGPNRMHTFWFPNKRDRAKFMRDIDEAVQKSTETTRLISPVLAALEMDR